MSFSSPNSTVVAISGSTFSITPTTIGNFYLVEVCVTAGGGSATSMSSSNATWTQLVAPTYAPADSFYCTVFIGKVTSTSTATVTITFSGTHTTVRGNTKEFSTTAGFSMVALDATGLTASGSTTSYPSLTPHNGSGELYWAFAHDAGTASAGSTSGYSYNVDASSNGSCWNVNCTSSAQAPTWADNNIRDGIAVLLFEAVNSPVVLAAAGTFTWVAPAGVTSVSSECWGGGGGGGSTVNDAGGGGGGGEYAAELTNTVIAGDSYTVVVGAGGGGGDFTSGNGGTGGNSTFTGTGATTVTAHSGGGGTTSGGSGTAGSGSTNSTHKSGGAGGTAGAGNNGGGGGGSSGGTAAAGNAGGNTSTTSGGAAGTAVTGGGPGGAGGNNVSNGNAPVSGPGGGGGGCGYSSAAIGGNGFDGQVTLTWSAGSVAGHIFEFIQAAKRAALY